MAATLFQRRLFAAPVIRLSTTTLEFEQRAKLDERATSQRKITNFRRTSTRESEISVTSALSFPRIFLTTDWDRFVFGKRAVWSVKFLGQLP